MDGSLAYVCGSVRSLASWPLHVYGCGRLCLQHRCCQWAGTEALCCNCNGCDVEGFMAHTLQKSCMLQAAKSHFLLLLVFRGSFSPCK